MGAKPFRLRCDQCGKAFEAYSINIRYCSNLCTLAAERELRVCRICGCRFANAWRENRREYCSEECEKEAKRRRHREWLKRNPAPKAEHPTVRCARCGKEFVRKKCNHLYCSKECHYQAHLEAMRKTPKEEALPPIVFSTCAVCGEAFDPKDADARGDYCSDRCERRAKERRARERERAKLEKRKKKWAPVYGCLYCGEVVQTPDGNPPEACSACGSREIAQLRRCHDCGKVVHEGDYRCQECNEKWRRGYDKSDVGADGYEVHL